MQMPSSMVKAGSPTEAVFEEPSQEAKIEAEDGGLMAGAAVLSRQDGLGENTDLLVVRDE